MTRSSIYKISRCAGIAALLLIPVLSFAQAPVPVTQDVQSDNQYLKMIDQSMYTPFISEYHGPLAGSITVKVAQWGIIDGYDLIGYVELTGDTIQDRIKLAEKYARAYGAEVVMPKGVTSIEQIKSTYRDRATQGFLLWRKKPSPAAAAPITVIDVNGRIIPERKAVTDDSLLQDLSETTGAPKVVQNFPTYGNTQRLTYNKLVENSPEIKKDNYRGASYPLKLFKIPEDIGIKIEGDMMMAMLATKSGENKLFLVVPADRASWVQDMIKSDKVLEYVYRPLGLYKERFPVLLFIDEMK